MTCWAHLELVSSAGTSPVSAPVSQSQSVRQHCPVTTVTLHPGITIIMALHTNIGLGDFILMDQINMEEFLKNLKIRCGTSRQSVWVVWADDSSTDFSIFWATWSLQQGSTEANENIYSFLTAIFSSFCFTVEAVSQPHSSIHKLAVFCIHSYLSRIKQEFPHLCWTVLMSLADSWSQSFPVTFSRRSQNNCHNPSPNPKSKSKVKSQKSEDLEWLYSAVVPPTHPPTKTFLSN